MARWQRRARLVLAVIVIGVAAAVALLTRQRVDRTAAPPPQRLDPKATLEVRGGDVNQVKGERRDIRIEFANQVSYDDGRTKLVAFKATVDDRGGRSFVVGGQEAWVGAERSSYDVRGGVSLQTADGLVVTTDTATFTEADGILKGPGAVKFRRENMSGEGVGFTYDRQQDALWLLDRAVIRFAATKTDAQTEVVSGTAGYSRLQRYARFERGMKMTRGAQVIEADQATMFMQPQVDEPDRIELRAGAHITGGGTMGAVQFMEARDINLDYADDGRTLQQAILAEQSVVHLARADGTPGQQLFAQYIDVALAGDGKVTKLSSRNNVRMELLPSENTPQRTITSTSLEGSGAEGKGLTALTFDGGTEFREPAPNNAQRVAKGRTLRVALGATGTVDNAVFAGGFTFSDGLLRAASADCTYDLTKGVLTVSSPKEGPLPRVNDERVAIDAPSIEVTLSPRKMTAVKGVTTTFGAGRRQPGDRGTTLLKDTEPVTIKSADFIYDETAGKSTFTGSVWLLQDATSIKSNKLELDDRQGNLDATGNVVAVLPIAGKPAEGAAATTSSSPSTSIGRGEKFQFADAKRRATFTTNAQLDGVQGNLRADQIDLVLAEKDNTLERMEAQGTTVRVLIEKREATGTRLTYLPSDEQYRLVGSPVRYIEGCRETTGRTLTFFRGSDRISIDGNEEQRTQTKGNSNCPDSPRH
jgi:lipopolysaccharide transport protein LptA